MRVLVCGSRHFEDDDHLYEILNEINDTWNFNNKITEIIHGGAKGADSLAGQFGRDYKIPVKVFPADWEKHGKAAGPIRNAQMLREGKPDIVILLLTS